MEWILSEEEYNPGITKEQRIEFVQDKNIFNENALITFACIQKAKVSTCADMSEEFGRNTDFYRTQKHPIHFPCKKAGCIFIQGTMYGEL
jgi:hypothetical protein